MRLDVLLKLFFCDFTQITTFVVQIFVSKVKFHILIPKNNTFKLHMQKKTAKTNNLAKNNLKMYIFGYIKVIFYA